MVFNFNLSENEYFPWMRCTRYIHNMLYIIHRTYITSIVKIQH